MAQGSKYQPLSEQIVEQHEESWMDRGLHKGLITFTEDGTRIIYKCANEDGTYSEIFTDPEAPVRASMFVVGLFVIFITRFTVKIHKKKK